MKRGLVTLDPPDAVRASVARRVADAQERVRDADCIAGLVYGDVSRADDIAYLGNLCVYWNEGVLAVPADGEIAFITKLSPRVHPWMRASSTISDLRSGPDLTKLIGGLLADLGASSRPRVGLFELDLWPSGLLADLAATDVELVDLGDAVRAARVQPAPDELESLRGAGAVLGAAADAAVALDGTPAQRIGDLERRLRRAGMVDVFGTAAQAADGSATAGAVTQLQHLWLRAVRSSGGALAEHAAGADRAVAALDDGATEAGVRAAVLAGAPAGVELVTSCVRHVDLASNGDSRRATDADGPLRAGETVVVAVTALHGPDHATVADTYLLSEDGPVALTRSEDRA